MRFAEKLVKAAKERRLTLKDLAEKCGVGYGTLRNYVAPGDKQRLPSAPKGIAIAKALSVDPDWLFSNSDVWPPPRYSPPPPFEIEPWPPDGITWSQVNEAILRTKAREVFSRLLDETDMTSEDKQHDVNRFDLERDLARAFGMLCILAPRIWEISDNQALRDETIRVISRIGSYLDRPPE